MLLLVTLYTFNCSAASRNSRSMTLACLAERGVIEAGNGRGVELNPSEKANLKKKKKET